jgi:catechol 2,3-dioxygenase-like lactoylglutathione lyase family enzyme
MVLDVALRVGSTVLNVSDMERAIAFWTAALGYVLRDPDADPRDFAVLCRPQGDWSNVSLQRSSDRSPVSTAFIWICTRTIRNLRSRA